MAVFLFYGQEEYLMEKEIKRLKKELLGDSFIPMAYKVFYNPDEFGTVLECVQSAPLMFGSALSVIYFDKYLIGNKSGLDNKQIESLDYALSNLNNGVNVIFVCKIPRDENKKPDSKKKLYKTIAKYAQVREFAQFKTYKKDLNAQIDKMVKEKGLKISSSGIALLIEQLGANLTLIDSELEKLKTAVYPSETIDTESVKKYCTSCEDVFILADLIIKRDKNELLKQYNLLTEKRHPLEIFSVLQNNFRQFVFIKNYEKKMSIEDMAHKLKLHEFIIKNTLAKLKSTSLDNLITIRKNLINAEYKIKTGQSSSGETELELALLR